MTTETMRLDQSGCEDFDRARALLADHRFDEALDWFEMAVATAVSPEVRSSAAAHAGAILCSQGRPWEVAAWCGVMRTDGPSDLADLLEGSACIQLDDIDRALALLERPLQPRDRWFPCSATTARIVLGHALWRAGRRDEASVQVVAAFELDATQPDVWEALARLCAETDFDPGPVVSIVVDADLLEVVAGLRRGVPAGVDVIAEGLWARFARDLRVLALAASFASRVATERALEWAVRLRASGLHDLCPLLAQARHEDLDARTRVRAAAVATATFGDPRARDALEVAVVALADEDLVVTLDELLELAPDLADSFVVAAATTAPRCLRLAAALRVRGADDEAFALLVHGLTLDDADDLDATTFATLVPAAVRATFVEDALERGDDEVVRVLEMVTADPAA